MAYFKVLSRHVPGRTEENHRKPQDILCPGRVSNPTPLERKQKLYRLSKCTATRFRVKEPQDGFYVYMLVHM
jgi:hypothetical protein